MEQLFDDVFPFWKIVREEDRKIFISSSNLVKKEKGSIIFNGGNDCDGVIIVKSGRIRVYITSPNGNEITLFRLLDGDLCIMSASCIIKNLSFESEMLFEEDSEILVIPKNVYNEMSEKYSQIKDYTLEIVSGKFSDVMWVFNQFVFSNMASRLAASLMEYRTFEDDNILNVTHETIARDLGTAREVVTRLLKQFQLNGIVKLSRGKIEILNMEELSKY